MFDFEDEGGWDDFEARECFNEDREDFADDAMEDAYNWVWEAPDTDLGNEW